MATPKRRKKRKNSDDNYQAARRNFLKDPKNKYAIAEFIQAILRSGVAFRHVGDDEIKLYRKAFVNAFEHDAETIELAKQLGGEQASGGIFVFRKLPRWIQIMEVFNVTKMQAKRAAAIWKKHPPNAQTLTEIGQELVEYTFSLPHTNYSIYYLGFGSINKLTIVCDSNNNPRIIFAVPNTVARLRGYQVLNE